MPGIFEQMQADAAGAPLSGSALVDQMKADAAAPAIASASAPKATDSGGFGSEILRQLELTGRHAITGITGLPALVGNGLNGAINLGIQGVNSAAGTNIPKLQMPSSVIQQGLDAAGFPQPKNALERVVGDATSAMAGTGASYKLGQLLMGGANPVADGVGRTLTAVPGNQVVAAGAAGAAGGGAREAGLGPGWQLAASLGGGAAGSLGAATLGGMASKGAQMAFPKQADPAVAAPAVEAATSTSPMPMSPQATADLTARTQSVLASNPGADPMAAARAADFKSLGMQGTLGQVTREPGLYAREQNWRGIGGIGDPLLSRFNDQNKQLAQILQSTAGSGSTEYQAGNSIMNTLKSVDDGLRSQVSKAYKDAAASTGAQLDVPLSGVAQDYAQTLHDFGSVIPPGVRNNFEALGLTTGTQKKTFTVDDAEGLLKVINQNKNNDPATNAALSQLSNSVKKAVLSADDQGGVFAQARALAKQRFDLHDQVPAMEAAAFGKVAPDDFARRFIINGNVQDVGGLANVLRTASPSALKELQGQVGNKLNNAAFGMNPAGDKVFRPEQYAKALNQQLGSDLLGQVYSPDQLDTLNTVGRVGAYINAEPAAAAVNRSGTGSTTIDMLQHIPIVGKVVNSAANKAMVNRSLGADLSSTGATSSQPDQMQELSRLLMMGGSRVPIH